MTKSTQILWQKWYDALPWNEKVRYHIFKKTSKIQDKLLDYEWMPEFMFADYHQRLFCFILRAHEWERSIYRRNLKACILCGKTRIVNV